MTATFSLLKKERKKSIWPEPHELPPDVSCSNWTHQRNNDKKVIYRTGSRHLQFCTFLTFTFQFHLSALQLKPPFSHSCKDERVVVLKNLSVFAVLIISIHRNIRSRSILSILSQTIGYVVQYCSHWLATVLQGLRHDSLSAPRDARVQTWCLLHVK